ncbi:malonate decarboxylase holo-ACP synthase [Acrocarpospora macrocephala]|uniref:Malonate decarboxylase holo-ACP synthase n=1 Tax=Acrocarpospora macrocephala TaxID=150177 RepID=A0A5M3WXG1_9ACTN|nr:malonate decarboxylase holo-ACP synthase [Acrocarpospora macrocephala]GES13624.1 malonate decarboxylase holo-ACP synthase [Acrocarpospora macrocephala]
MGVIVRPHDLLRLDVTIDGLPDWARESLAACPWGVVRRAPYTSGLIPVGVRGTERWQRHAALVSPDSIIRVVRPEDLRERRPRLPRLAAALSVVAAELGDDAVWGPVGSVGFELATGRPVTHPGSDLDLLLRAPRRLERAQAARLVTAFAGVPVDCQLETPRGGVSLTEWARPGGLAMARTERGPHLVKDPWAPG